MTKDVEAADFKVSNLSYPDMVTFFHQQIGRIEMTWFRMMYLHAAMVGVLAFFAEAQELYLMQRVLVFAFYTANLLIFHISLREGYGALKQARLDLIQFPETEGNVDQWFRKRRHGMEASTWFSALFVTWLLIAFLLFKYWIFN